MKVCVYGIGHLGAVTAAGCVRMGHEVVALDENPRAYIKVSEPGMDCDRVLFTNGADYALEGAEVLWVCFDTPVDPAGVGDVDFVVQKIEAVLPEVEPSTLVLISSQLPVGTIAGLEKRWPHSFACSPENLRVGRAMKCFLEPERVVVGIRNDEQRPVIEALLGPLQTRIEWMSVESAEMTKHAINAFLATSIAFINEIARLCPLGADPKDVARGLMSDERVGTKAYLKPGGPYSNEHLGRDVIYLSASPLMRAVQKSNDGETASEWLELS